MLFFVSKYIPKDLYGFLEDDNGHRVFFHMSEFNTMGGPPPIVGEPVEVERLEEIPGKNSCAYSVLRTIEIAPLIGTVTRFDHRAGYGFVLVDKVYYFLHRSEFIDGALPVVGATVEFFALLISAKDKPPRACHARILAQGTH